MAEQNRRKKPKHPFPQFGEESALIKASREMSERAIEKMPGRGAAQKFIDLTYEMSGAQKLADLFNDMTGMMEEEPDTRPSRRVSDKAKSVAPLPSPATPPKPAQMDKSSREPTEHDRIRTTLMTWAVKTGKCTSYAQAAAQLGSIHIDTRRNHEKRGWLYSDEKIKELGDYDRLWELYTTNLRKH